MEYLFPLLIGVRNAKLALSKGNKPMTSTATASQGFDWNAGILANIEMEDTSLNKLVSRTAKRIADKGFSLIDITKTRNNTGFNWGRSSYADDYKTVWSIVFEDENNTEFAVCIVEQQIVYHQRNPYDRVARDANKNTISMQATDETKRVLEWK